MGKILLATLALTLTFPRLVNAEPTSIAVNHYVALLSGMQILHACTNNAPGHAEGRLETAVEVAAEAQTEISHAESLKIAQQAHESFNSMSSAAREANCKHIMKDGAEVFVDRLLSN